MERRMDRRQFGKTLAIFALATVTGCARPNSSRTDYDGPPFTAMRDVWQITRIGENEFLVDGIPFKNDLEANKKNAISGIRFIQDQLGCKLLKVDYSKEARSDIRITVEDPNCVLNGFKLKGTASVGGE
jgi:hypothetical protein